MLPIRSVETVEKIETPLSTDMINALDLWHNMYTNHAPWLTSDDVKVESMNLAAMIASEIARQVTLEMKWHISGPTGKNGEDSDTPRAEYLRNEFEKLMHELRKKLEQGCAAGGMAIRPYPKDGHIYFGWTTAWGLYPVAFDDNGGLQDVIFRDIYQDGDTTYTRLERHTMQDDGKIKITQRAFMSKYKNTDSIGKEIPLTDVPQWAELQPEAILSDTDGQMFGWYKTAAANNVDIDSAMGVSVFHKAVDLIKQADMQYSRMLWEFEGSELAIDVDPLALRENADGSKDMPKLSKRLFRGVNLDEDHYNVFSPTIRDQSLLNGLNRLLMMIEDLTGLSRGTLSDAPLEARTATELRILRQRTYATIADNQTALEHCLRDVVRAMDKYADLYNLAPAGDYEVSFEWDDSILTDRTQEMGERLELMSQGIIGKAEMRQWYTGETKAQAEAAIQEIQDSLLSQTMDQMMAQMQVQATQQQDQTDLDTKQDERIQPPASKGDNA
jgi:A118 family predicted phage portal protein